MLRVLPWMYRNLAACRDLIAAEAIGFRWGTCTIHSKLPFLLEVYDGNINCLIAHELSHTHARNHSKAFWNDVDKAMPVYKERIDWL